jgi:hypothetical protein
VTADAAAGSVAAWAAAAMENTAINIMDKNFFTLHLALEN